MTQPDKPAVLDERLNVAADLELREKGPGKKPHGRLAYTLHFKKFGEPRFIDFSVMPLAASPSPPEKETR